MNVYTIILIAVSTLWAILEAWLILRDSKRGKGKTTSDSRTRHYNFLSITLSPIVAAFMTWIPWINSLGVRSMYIFGVGIGIMVLGLGLRIWSVAVLGKYFRTTIELEDNQKVIQNGPYRHIRHPSYTGLLLTCIGYGAALQNVISFIIVVTFPTIALLYRIKMEETTLASGMGTAYTTYQRKTKKLIPGIW